MSEIFWEKLYRKKSGLFASFCLLWDFLSENMKLVDKLKYEVFNQLSFGTNFFFGTVFGHFS